MADDALSLANVLSRARANFPASGRQAVSDLVAPLRDPMGAAKGIGDLVAAMAMKHPVGQAAQQLIPSLRGMEQPLDQAGQYLADRYGGFDELKRTLASDPVGALMDSTMVLGGAGAAARAPSAAMRMTGRIRPEAVTVPGQSPKLSTVMAESKMIEAPKPKNIPDRGQVPARQVEAENIAYEWATGAIKTPEVKKRLREKGYDVDFRQADRGAFLEAVDIETGNFIKLEL